MSFSIVSMIRQSEFPVKPGKTFKLLCFALTYLSFLELINKTARLSHESGNLLSPDLLALDYYAGLALTKINCNINTAELSGNLTICYPMCTICLCGSI